MDSKNILIVEDSRLFGDILTASLKSECPCMSIIKATTYQEAVRMIQSTDISVCLLDIHLPDGSGLDLILRIKHTNPEATVIVLTAHDGKEFEKAAYQNGATQFLSKRNFHIDDIATFCHCC